METIKMYPVRKVDDTLVGRSNWLVSMRVTGASIDIF